MSTPRPGAKSPRTDFRFAKSPNGHTTFVLKSWLQKAIRRGLEEDALYCAVQLDLAGFPGAVWNTLDHSASEDIGLAEANVHATLTRLFALWKKDHGAAEAESADEKPTEDGAPERLYMVHAVLLCVRAKKSRLVDDMLNVSYADLTPRQVPDWALDKHTQEGRALGRGFEHFFDEGTVLENRAQLEGEEQYAARARELLVKRGASDVRRADSADA